MRGIGFLIQAISGRLIRLQEQILYAPLSQPGAPGSRDEVAFRCGV